MALAPLTVVRDDGQFWAFDLASRIARSPSARVTDHPVESGTSISDHVVREPDRLTVAATVTRSPMEGRTYGQPTGREREAAAVAFLGSCWGQMLTLDFPGEKIEGYVLAGFAHERGAYGATKFSLEFREIVVVDSQTVDIPLSQAAPDTSAGLASEVDAGEQGTITPDTGTTGGGTTSETAQSSSWLYQIVYGEEAA